MAKRKVTPTDENVVVQEVNVTAAPFWERYQKLIIYALGALAIAVAGYFLYKNMVVGPKQKEAEAAMWQAEMSFEKDSLQQALNGPAGGYDGFLSIIDKYSGTPAANLANYYAGVCYLQSNDIDNAIKYMEDFSPEGTVLPAMKYGILGDCYSEKGEMDKALGLYEKAADATDVDVVAVYYLKKLGMLHEKQNHPEKAIEAFKRIHEDYPNKDLNDWKDIEKYIYRAGKGQ